MTSPAIVTRTSPDLDSEEEDNVERGEEGHTEESREQENVPPIPDCDTTPLEIPESTISENYRELIGSEVIRNL